MTAPDNLQSATAQMLAALGDEPMAVRISRAADRAREADAEVERLIRIGRAVEACTRVPGESVVRDPDGRAVSSASVLLATLISAGKGQA